MAPLPSDQALNPVLYLRLLSPPISVCQVLVRSEASWSLHSYDYVGVHITTHYYVVYECLALHSASISQLTSRPAPLELDHQLAHTAVQGGQSNTESSKHDDALVSSGARQHELLG